MRIYPLQWLCSSRVFLGTTERSVMYILMLSQRTQLSSGTFSYEGLPIVSTALSQALGVVLWGSSYIANRLIKKCLLDCLDPLQLKRCGEFPALLVANQREYFLQLPSYRQCVCAGLTGTCPWERAQIAPLSITAAPRSVSRYHMDICADQP